MIFLSKTLKKQWHQMTVLIMLIILLLVGAAPGYITGKWSWKQPPPIANLKQLKNVYKSGLKVSKWQTLEKTQQPLGLHKWSWQRLRKESTSTEAILILLPQTGPKNQPEVEWTEINSWGKWDIAQERSVEFTVTVADKDDTNEIVKVKAKYFRASTKEQTFAILQWYAMPQGGNPSPLNWFVSDQLAQWQNQRTAWVAVSILFPIEPLGQVETSWTEVKSLGEQVQIALLQQVF